MTAEQTASFRRRAISSEGMRKKRKVDDLFQQTAAERRPSEMFSNTHKCPTSSTSCVTINGGRVTMVTSVINEPTHGLRGLITR